MEERTSWMKGDLQEISLVQLFLSVLDLSVRARALGEVPIILTFPSSDRSHSPFTAGFLLSPASFTPQILLSQTIFRVVAANFNPNYACKPYFLLGSAISLPFECCGSASNSAAATPRAISSVQSYLRKMFWRMAGLSTTSPVESLLDRDGFTLEELLDEDELIQECKSLNTRLINFLRGKTQIEQLVKYVTEEPPEKADNKRAFKFPFIACEIFTCEIEVIIKTMVEDEELMDLLFSFLEPDRSHGTLLAGYFSKVVICLLLRKTAAVMRYLQAHQEIFKKLVDLIGITSIMEVLIRLVVVDDIDHSFQENPLRWLVETSLLEMLVDKLSPPNSSEARANAADTLSAVSRLTHSELATKLSSPSFIEKLFRHTLEDEDSRSTLVHSLTVCISLLDPKRYAMAGPGRGQYIPDSFPTATPETINGMLQRLGGLLKLLNVEGDEGVLPTTYGELRPPLGSHRLKIVEFLAVLLRTGGEGAQQELVNLGAIQLILNLFFDYPFNNLLHHQVENIVTSCIESNNKMLIDHLLVGCGLVGRLLEADENPFVTGSDTKPTIPAPGKAPPKIGNLGHLTRIANRLLQAANNNSDILAHLQGNAKWVEWQSDVLQKRNSLENVCQWTCGRPTTVRDRPVDSDEDDFREKDYDISSMVSNSREAFRYGMYDNEDGEEGIGIVERDDEDVFFDDESAEVVMSSLRLGEEHDRSNDSFLSGPNWFAFPDDRPNQSLGSFLVSNPIQRFEDGQGNSVSSSSSDDEVVVGEDEDLVDTATSSDSAYFSASSANGTTTDNAGTLESIGNSPIDDLSSGMEKLEVANNLSFFHDENSNEDLFSTRPLDWESWKEPSSLEGTSGRMTFSDNNPFKDDLEQFEAWEAPGSMTSTENELKRDEAETNETASSSPLSNQEEAKDVPPQLDQQCDSGGDGFSKPLFDGSPKFVGVENEGTAKAMEHALREGIVGEAGPLLHPAKGITQIDAEPRKDADAAGELDFTDVNYWRSDYNQSVAEVKSV
ncbi:hypothetical protein GOP47_0016358 [Adiantum capillus-veneris]|uniref:SIT4 phosphatase-associated family protein n=1 Tax=Adiantum capillus-veneris TaxID=13818 RepID=A0A9D4UIF6_ADICA|nr:hypothetical protein GOP47_0016358 [Adiantum capillus-veneris]